MSLTRGPAGVSITVEGTETWGLRTPGPGLVLDVPVGGRQARRPALRLEAASRYRLRLMSGDAPLLWVRIDDWWDRAVFLRGTAPSPWRLPSLSAPEVRAVSHAPGSAPWWEAWEWKLARELVEAPASVLYSGQWCLRPVGVLSADTAERHPVSPMEWQFGQPPQAPHSLDAVTRFGPAWNEDWWDTLPAQRPGAVLPLRAPSAPDDGRVKSWRKRARDGTLPPALLLYVDILAKWLVLDGHDRLHAALLEGVEPPLLGLWPSVLMAGTPSSSVREAGALFSAEFQLRTGATPQVVERVNRMLLLNFAQPLKGTVSRAWPIPGGLAAWRQEVLLARRQRERLPLTDEDWDWLVSPDTR
ncbi:hypothetical protein D7Y13_33350 [Corallococcus praedator]|uniref:DUF2169 domain-containing protein n=1 Tax=Corallococcus praedator TaxID=2316724 RepID=A0ABX9QB78_9BACT|nr:MULTISPECIES: hypothetical protein [Corallococcus]RKH21940.1 hypothetical protein D7X75_36440 [Corallococcus sp. CA031C]RKH94465.1 hypothetical protein D7Y13_33350 [Corallococcus praedator]